MKVKRACPKDTEAKSNEPEKTSSIQADQGSLPQADHNKSQSDSAAPEDSTVRLTPRKHKQGQYDWDKIWVSDHLSRKKSCLATTVRLASASQTSAVPIQNCPPWVWMVPPLLNILRLVLRPALVFSFINAYLPNYGCNTRTMKTCHARTLCRIPLHGYLCVYCSYGFITCVLVGNMYGTL